ncbi:hypothetical protein ACWCQZ_44320 [Streptomyces sp. NPDC002285]
MPKCAWILIGSLLLICSQTIGLAATLTFLVSAAFWVLTTEAALVIVASLAAWHLLNAHTPRFARARH